MDNLNKRIDDRLSFKRARHRQKKNHYQVVHNDTTLQYLVERHECRPLLRVSAARLRASALSDEATKDAHWPRNSGRASFPNGFWCVRNGLLVYETYVVGPVHQRQGSSE